MAKPANLVQWVKYFRANGICHDSKNGLQLVIDFQDYIGRRAIGSIVTEIIDGCDTVDLGDFLGDTCWVFCATLDREMAGRIIKEAMFQHKMRQVHADLQRHFEASLTAARAELEDKYLVQIQRGADVYQQERELSSTLRRHLVESEQRCEALETEVGRVRAAVAVLKSL
ncbi:MAG: hypothetical protein M0036_14130 [Desulfobacteraceae bacterium]|nr:hypothetical protein [Desulfobacteraceae bacterium]